MRHEKRLRKFCVWIVGKDTYLNDKGYNDWKFVIDSQISKQNKILMYNFIGKGIQATALDNPYWTPQNEFNKCKNIGLHVIFSILSKFSYRNNWDLFFAKEIHKNKQEW